MILEWMPNDLGDFFYFIMENINRAYYAIIPANVRYDKRLTPNAKLLYAEITALCNEKGYCWATNKYFAELYGVSTVSISKWISSLVEFGYLKSHIKYKEGTKEILNRYLTLFNEGIKHFFNTPIKEKFKDNNTLFNNTYNNIEGSKTEVFEDSTPESEFKIYDSTNQQEIEFPKKVAQKKGFKIPTVVEIKTYCLERKNNVDSEKFFNFYQAKDWMIGRNKMKDWKAAVRTWESRDDNKQNNNNNGNDLGRAKRR